MSDDEKEEYLKKVECLRNKVKKRPFLFSEHGTKLNGTINEFTELLHNNNSVTTPKNKPPLQYLLPPPSKSRICSFEDFNNCNDISNRCAPTPLGLTILEDHVNKIKTEINEYRYKSDNSDSMLKTLNCLKKFLDSNNYNSSNGILYTIQNYIKKIKKLPPPEPQPQPKPQAPLRTGNPNKSLPSLNR